MESPLTLSTKLATLSALKPAGQKLTVLTAADYPTGRLLDEAGVDLILVGDSLGMVVLGYPDTVEVTLADMIHHTRAVRRGVMLRSAAAAALRRGMTATSKPSAGE